LLALLRKQLGKHFAAMPVHVAMTQNRGPGSAMHRSLSLTLHRARDTQAFLAAAVGKKIA
jgi:hypothetical protein